jgi:hypothetical protein
VAGAAGAVLFVAVFLFEGATRVGYSPTRHPVSALALGGRGWVQIASFLITGTAMGAFALGVRRMLGPGPAATWGSLLLAAFALGLVASGVFVMDPPAGFPPGQPGDAAATWHGIAHDIAGLVVFTALPAAAVVLAARFRTTRDLEWLGPVSVGAGALTVGLFIAFAAVEEAGGSVAGLLQRGAIVAGWGWVAVVAIALLVVSTADAGSREANQPRR